jgi:5-hydroxyisourate hydrolase
MSLSTHVLDATSGKPAAGVPVTLLDAEHNVVVAGPTTDDDGRIGKLAEDLAPGIYRLRFDTATYFAAHGVETFYPEIVIAFEITDSSAKYHVPVLLSPFAYSTYRGS